MDPMIYVDNEISDLQAVIIHSPDRGISRISPKRSDDLLFDDIVHLPLMKKEHDVFTDVLNCFVDEENVLEVESLVMETIKSSKELTSELINKVISHEGLPNSYCEKLIEKEPSVLKDLLITGYDSQEDHIYFDPIPNFIFTRDIACVVKEHVIITKAAKKARYRENLLTQFIFNGHPKFNHLTSQNLIIDLNDIDKFPPNKKGEIVSIEGGDLMVLNNDYFLIGCSERTTEHAFNSIKQQLFEKELISNVVKVNIPNDRSFMHIDTLFTRIDTNKIICYKPIIFDGMSSTIEVHRKTGTNGYYPSIKDFILEEINPSMEFIFTGNGESPYQEREQWTDGCNMVAVKPGVGITYDRNLRTEKALSNHGFDIISSDKLLKMNDLDSDYIGQLTDTIITIPSSELSRARGGSHCMTCPIQRKIS